MAEPKTQAIKRFIIWMVAALVIVAADQVTKWAIVEWVALYDKVPLNSYVNLTHQRNPGAAFSFLADAGGWQRWFFTVLAIGVSVVLLVWLIRLPRREWMTGLGLGLIDGRFERFLGQGDSHTATAAAGPSRTLSAAERRLAQTASGA